VRRIARDFLLFVACSPALAVFALPSTASISARPWARDMRNLMVASLAISSRRGSRCDRSATPTLGRAIVHYAAARGLEAWRYPAAAEEVVRIDYLPLPVLRGEGWVRGCLHEYECAVSPLTRIASHPTSPRKRGEVNSRTGQSSAVIVAASAPTISDSESRPVRSSVEERSFLMSSTRPRPL